MIRLWVLLLVFALGLTQPALAHSPIKGIGAFYNGLLHPLLVPSHALLIVSLGLLLGRRAPSRESQLGWPAFALSACGALLVGLWWGDALPEPLLIGIALCAASLVLLDWSSPWPASVILATAAGISIGLNSSAELAGHTASRSWLTVTGIAIGTVLWVTYVGGLAARSERPWHGIAVRVAASWMIAISLMILALWSVHGTSG